MKASDRTRIRVEVSTEDAGGDRRATRTTLLMMVQLVLLAAGVGFAVSNLVTLRHWYHYWDAWSWPQQRVSVEISRLNHPDTRDVGCAQPHIEYAYAHDGEPRSSTLWGFTLQRCGAPAWARAIIDRYPRGWHHAHVDPESGRAVLDPDTSALWVIAAGAPACLALFWLVGRLYKVRRE